MIFTRAEYAAARVKHAEFYAILDALLITYTFVFLGCGVNDPDIRLLLENYNFRFVNARRHFITMPDDALSQEEIAALESSMNLKLLLYSPRSSHRELIDSIAELKDSVDYKRGKLATSQDW